MTTLAAREPDPEDRKEIAPGIHCLSVPTPFAVGAVNAFLIEDEPLTLIDPGPASTHSLSALERGLRDIGFSLRDIELLVVTHQHIDHLGLAGYIAETFDSETTCLDLLVAYAHDFAASAIADDEFAVNLMRLHGVPPDTIAALSRVSALTREWGGNLREPRSLSDGSLLDLGSRSFRVIHAPGHSPTDTVFFDEANGVLFSGDHLLPTVSSNALVSRDWRQDTELTDRTRRRPLCEYIDSLRQTRELAATVTLPGHGAPISDHRALIDARLDKHEQRAEQMRQLIAERPRTAHAVAEAIWGQIATTQAFLTLSEVLGHIDLLLRDGAVVEYEPEPGLIVYRSA